MNVEELLKILGTDSLSEAQQTEFATKLEDLVSFRVNEALETEKEKLIEEMEEKYEEYKSDITSKFSNFVDEILEEEMIIPENILEFARYGELYKDLIDQIKVRVGIDEGILDEEARDLLKEAKDEIIRLQNELNEEIELRLESEQDAQTLALEAYKHKVCESVPSAQRKNVLVLLEGTKTKEAIDRKYSFIMENKLFEGAENPSQEEDPEGKGSHTINEDLDPAPANPDTESPFNVWLEVLRGGK